MAKQKDEIIIAALISNPTIKKASEACGVSESAIYARMNKPEFKEKYERARMEMLERYSNQLQQRIGVASDIMLYTATSDKNASPQVRLNAAEAIIRTSLKLTEQTEILKQLAELRKAVFPDE